jgi:hypothetical protein
MRMLLTIALATCLGCTAPRDSAEHFARPKYDLRTSPKDKGNKPAVAQTWWSSLWFWQRRNGKYPIKEKP